MFNISEIMDYLKSEGIQLAGPLAREDGDASTLYAFIEVSRSIEGHQKPSNQHLRKLVEKILEKEVKIKFVLNDISNMDLEAGLRATLLHAFPGFIRNAFLVLKNDTGLVWIVPKSEKIRSVIDDVSFRSEVYLRNANIKFDKIKLTTDENLPSRVAILSELRIAAPEAPEILAARLATKGFSPPPLDYINRHLDSLRKADFVVRRKDGKYCLTASALKVLGTMKRRGSPDVVRFLDLARRKSL